MSEQESPYLVDQFGHVYPRDPIFARMDGMRPCWDAKTKSTVKPAEKTEAKPLVRDVQFADSKK